MYASWGAPTTAPEAFESSAVKTATAIVRRLRPQNGEPPIHYGDSPGELNRQANERLGTAPAPYHSVLDGIALLRSQLPNPIRHTHYALLLRGWTIVGLVWLAELSGDAGEPILYRPASCRQLMSAVLEADADKVLLATALTEDDGGFFDEGELRNIRSLHSALEVFDVELLDYLLLSPGVNWSWAYQQHGAEGMDEGVTIEVLTHHAIPAQA